MFRRSNPITRLMIAAAVGLMMLSTTIPVGAVVTEVYKLAGPGSIGGEGFGGAVAIEGGYVVVGASHGGTSNGGGAAYIFEASTGQQLHKLVSDDLTPSDAFGASVSLSGSRVLVGASHKDFTSLEDGAAYLFDLTSGNQIARIDRGENPSRGDSEYFVFHFGHSVAISGQTALIGTTGYEPFESSAYLYDLGAADPPLDLLINIPSGHVPIESVVALDGNTAIIGTPKADIGGTGNTVGRGAAFIFDATTGVKTVDLLADDASHLDDDNFGQAVSISGNLALVGAPTDSDLGDRRGSAYLFDITTGEQLFKLTAQDAADSDVFGASVAIHNRYAIVGAPSTNFGGTVYIYDLLTGQYVTQFSGSDTVVGDRFGASLSVYGDSLIVGAPFVDGEASTTGTAYLFTIPEPGTVVGFVVLGPVVFGRSRRSPGQAGG